MKHYPSISREPRYGSPSYGFEKLDGSNIRAEWSKKRGFYKFGARKTMIGPDSLYGESIDLIGAQDRALAEIFTDERWERCVCFFEFHGANSFAGVHENEPHRTTLIDIDVYKHGQLDPREFVRLFSSANGIDVAKLVWSDGFNKDMERQVREGTLPGQSFEGVVGKVPSGKRWTPPYLFKVKNAAWIEKVKSRYGLEGIEELL